MSNGGCEHHVVNHMVKHMVNHSLGALKIVDVHRMNSLFTRGTERNPGKMLKSHFHVPEYVTLKDSEKH